MITIASFLAATVVFSPAVHAKDAVGSADIVVESVFGTMEDEVRTLALADPVYLDEEIVTEAGAATEITFLDGTTLTIGEESNIFLDKFLYDPNAGTGEMILDLTLGVFEVVTGSIPDDGYEVTTPTATLGVRGTMFSVVVAADGTTTVTLGNGVVTVTGPGGEVVTISTPGLSTTTVPAVGGVTVPPSAPALPPAAVTTQVAGMNSTISSAAGTSAGTAAGPAASGAAAGGISTGAIVGGVAAAAALGAAVSAVTAEEATAVTSATTTTTTTSN